MDRIVTRMERDEFDPIAVGGALIADPVRVDKIRHGDRAALRDFDPAVPTDLV